MNDSKPPISVVVPIGPGEPAWPGLLACLAPFRDQAEVILSTTERLEVAAPIESTIEPAIESTVGPAIRQVRGSAGRAAQLNRGVRAAGGAWLWLLHADSRPSVQAIRTVLCHVQRPPAAPALGWCALTFADGPRLARLNAFGANLRSRLFALPFGDQGWLLPRGVFDRLGGFDEEFGRGEDLDFIIRARAAGIAITPLGCRMTSSARRYRAQGWQSTTWEHLRLTLRLRRRALDRLAAAGNRRERSA